MLICGLAPGHAGYKRIAVTTTIESHAPADELEALHAPVVQTTRVGHTFSNAVEPDLELAARQ